PCQRTRRPGSPAARPIGGLDKRVLLLGSGGLSHDPPVPQFDTAPEPVRQRLIDGRGITADEPPAPENRVIPPGRAFPAGTAPLQPLNPDWDNHLLDILADGDLTPIDAWTVADFVAAAGNSSHEVPTWIAASPP